VGFDVVVVGGGTAGCVLAARLSENADRSVCLVEAGPDYGPLEEQRWPSEILDARTLARTHDWGPGGEDGRSLGGRMLGGSSAVNACMAVAGSPADYDEWGEGWSFAELRPHLERAQRELRAARSNTDRPTRFQESFLEAAQGAGSGGSAISTTRTIR
jgi:choline dehydrogenase